MNYKPILKITLAGLLITIIPCPQTEAGIVKTFGSCIICIVLLKKTINMFAPSDIEKLQQHTKKLQNNFKYPFELIDKYKNDQPTLQSNIHLFIISSSATTPLLENYQNQLQQIANDKKKLNALILKSSHCNSIALQPAHELNAKLSNLAITIISNPSYLEACKEKEKTDEEYRQTRNRIILVAVGATAVAGLGAWGYDYYSAQSDLPQLQQPPPPYDESQPGG
jgi:hypothetical protein